MHYGLDFTDKSYGLSFWFNKPNNIADFEQTLVEWCDDNDKGLIIGFKNFNNSLKLYYSVYNGTIWNEVTSSLNVQNDTWYHVSTCLDSSVDSMCISINGTFMEDEIFIQGHCSASNFGSIYIGQDSQGNMSSCSISSVKAGYRCWLDPEKDELYNIGIE